MGQAAMWAWDDTNKKWVRVAVTADGKLQVETDCLAHHATHENGGSDEVGVGGLSGLLADDQHVLDAEVLAVAAALVHAARHENGGDDEISIAGLAGESVNLAAHKLVKDAHHSNEGAVTFIIDGGGAAITTGQKGHIELPWAGTINRASLLADQEGTIQIDIWKDTYANFPPGVENSICGINKPIIDSGWKDEIETLTFWTTAVSKGDILAFNVDSCATITRVTLTLRIAKS